MDETQSLVLHVQAHRYIGYVGLETVEEGAEGPMPILRIVDRVLAQKMATIFVPCYSSVGRRFQTRDTKTQGRAVGRKLERSCCHARGLEYGSLEPGQRTQVDAYLDFLIETNKQMNLTAVRDREEAVDRHVNDSLALLPVIQEHSKSRGECRLLDIGSGAGLPGMILAIAQPDWKVTLLDATKKKCDFAMQAARVCGLDNVSAVWGRAEQLSHEEQHREVYDVAVARAVAELRVLVEYSLPFVRKGGIFVAAKGAQVKDEVAAASKAVDKLGGELAGVFSVESFSPEGQRTAIVVKKRKHTADHFPRPPGVPSKNPL